MSAVRSLFLPMLRRRERLWRRMFVASAAMVVVSLGVALFPPRSVGRSRNAPAIAVLVCLGIAVFTRARLLSELYESVGMIRRAAPGTLPCPSCLQPLHGVREPRCPECGRDAAPVDIRREWMNAYEIHLDAATFPDDENRTFDDLDL